MKKEIFSTLGYFEQFGYPPTLEELYTFLPVRTSKKSFQREIEELVRDKKLIAKEQRVARVKNARFHTAFRRREQASKKLIRTLGPFLTMVSRFSSIELIGLSGSLAMANGAQSDDIDLFVISTRNRLFTARAAAILTASLLGRRRKRLDKHSAGKICLNLFIDRRRLEVPEGKKTLYVAHEILQMKPLIDKDGAYASFIKANSWIFRIFPNARRLFAAARIKRSKPAAKGIFPEAVLKAIQLAAIRRHTTTELILPGQLWFFPDDYEKRIGA